MGSRREDSSIDAEGGARAVVFEDVEDAMVLPAVVRVSPNLHAAAFPLMKLVAARFTLERAARAGELGPDVTVLETTSGTYGLALAIVCARMGRPLTLVCDAGLEDGLRHRLEDLGARVDLVAAQPGSGGSQRARLERLEMWKGRHERYFWPNQYHDHAHREAYRPVARYLIRALGEVDVLVGAVGSGASLCGIASVLRTHRQHLRVVAVDVHGSVLFGRSVGVRKLHGIGNEIVPANLDHTAIDEVHWISPADAVAATRDLHRKHRLYRGPTSGASFLVARHVAHTHPERVVVALLPDGGHRYGRTVYNDAWLEQEGFGGAVVPQAPQPVDDPGACSTAWCCYDWARRTLETSTSDKSRPHSGGPAEV